MSLKIRALSQYSHRVAQQAGGGLAPGAEQDVQDGAGLEVAEHPVVDRAGDGAEDVGPRVLLRRRDLLGDPGLNLPGSSDERHQLVEGQRSSHHRRRVERRGQQLVQARVAEADEAAGYRDRHHVADGGHELRRAALQCPRHALVGEAGDIGLKCRHPLGDELGEDGGT
jgi:hypothetical protein